MSRTVSPFWKELADAFWSSPSKLAAATIPGNLTSKTALTSASNEARLDIHRVTGVPGRYAARLQVNREAESETAKKILASPGITTGHTGTHKVFGAFQFDTGANFNARGVYEAICQCRADGSLVPPAAVPTPVSATPTAAYGATAYATTAYSATPTYTWNPTTRKFVRQDGYNYYPPIPAGGQGEWAYDQATGVHYHYLKTGDVEWHPDYKK